VANDVVTGTLHYLNADFDLSLRKIRWPLKPSLERAVAALTAQGLLLGGEGDGVLTRVSVPEDFVEYLRRQGREIPRIFHHSDIDEGMRFSPFGWNEETIAINSRQRDPARHPDVEVVRYVNGRVFSAAVERELLGEEDAGRIFSSLEELKEWLGGQGTTVDGWVVKADHGNAGLGNRRLPREAPDGTSEKFITRLLAQDERVVVEPWRRRLLDFCAVFTLREDGGIDSFRLHETINSSEGALIGVIFDEGATKWRDAIAKAADTLAGELSRKGYFGPVCFDSFSYLLDGVERLRALADLNCRRPMSDAVFRLWNEAMSDRVVLWRFFSSRRLDFEALGALSASESAFCRRERRGVLFTSPWSIGIEGRTLPAPKVAAAFVGNDRAEVRSMEASFRGQCEKQSA
jgi:hypothetical protein